MKTKGKAQNIFWGFLFLLPVIVAFMTMLTIAWNYKETGTALSISALAETFATAFGQGMDKLTTACGSNSSLTNLLSNFLTNCGFSVGTGMAACLSWYCMVCLMRLIVSIFAWVFELVHHLITRN